MTTIPIPIRSMCRFSPYAWGSTSAFPSSHSKRWNCGLFHDLGKVDVPLKILNKQRKLTEHEFKVIQKHSLNSVRHIAKLKAPRELKSKIMLAPFEHHLKYDLSGYPRSWRSEPVSCLAGF